MDDVFTFPPGAFPGWAGMSNGGGQVLALERQGVLLGREGVSEAVSQTAQGPCAFYSGSKHNDLHSGNA